MKRLITLALFLFISQLVFSQVSVKGYFRKNGTYVQPHMRSKPDANPYNNYSYPGNTNPYTGKTATGNPDTYLYKYKKSTSTVKSPSVSTVVPPLDSRVYYTDSLGISTMYTVKQSVVTVSKVYSLDHRHIGYIHEHENGRKVIYDAEYNQIKTYEP